MLALLFVLAVAVLPACTAETTNQSEETTDASSLARMASVERVLTVNDSLPFPVYGEFEGIEPLFEQQTDSVYVINFWATWCKPCVEELPYFERLAEEMADQPVKIIMVSLDFKSQVATKLRTFVEERPLELPVVALTDNQYDNWIDKVDSDWSGAIPVTLIYRKGARFFYPSQFPSYGDLAESVRQLL